MSSSGTTESTPTGTGSSGENPPPVPPIAKREEDRVVYAGVLKDTEATNDESKQQQQLIRQSESSTNALLDPPRPIPDPYGWLRDSTRTDPDVLSHLRAENAYTQQMTSHLSSLRQVLNDEMVSSLQETDYTTPAPRDGKFWYYTRTNVGESYKIYCRAPIPIDNGGSESESITAPKIEWDGSPSSPILPNEEIYLNVNSLAKDKPYCAVSSVSISPNTDTSNLLAYAVDFSGDEIYSLYVIDLDTGKVVDGGEEREEDKIECYSLTWGRDSRTLFYVVMDEAHRPYRVYRRQLKLDKGTGTEEGTNIDDRVDDELIFEQNDDLYWTSIHKSSDKKYLFISTSSSETSEVYYLDLEDENAKLQRIAKARTKVLYDVDHFNGHWIITSNVDGTPNMRFMSCPVSVGPDCGERWVDVVMDNGGDGNSGNKLFDGGYERSLDSVEAFEKYLVATGREGGIPRVWVIEPSLSSSSSENENDAPLTAKKSTQLVFDETAYDVGVGINYDYSTDKLMLYYDSLTTPLQSLQVTMDDPNNKEKRTVLKEKNIPGYDKAVYGCQRITVTVRDGTEVPVSMVYRNEDMEEHVTNGTTMPVHLVGYGSYGACSG